VVENIRTISKIFGIIFVVEVAILSAIVWWSSNGINVDSERIKTIASIIASLITALLTTMLVYSNFYQRPELAFTGFLIEPKERTETSEQTPTGEQHCAKEEYLEQVGGNYQVRNDKYSKKFPTWVKKVECKSPPSFLRVRNDLTNLGFFTANIHEIRYFKTFPSQALLYVLPKRISLEHQEREVIEIPQDILSKTMRIERGTYGLKFEVIGATMKCSKQLWIHISEDLKTIKWSESRFKILTGFC
jgi:hypothetical protein